MSQTKPLRVRVNDALTRLGAILPQRFVNWLLLSFPFVYGLGFINYETFSFPIILELLGYLESVFTVEGDILECGSARCGTSIFMAKHLQRNRIEKRIFALDVYGEILPGMDEEVRRKAVTPRNSIGYITKKLQSLKLSAVIIPVKGLFKETLPLIESALCLVLIDTDLGRTVQYCLETSWLKLSVNGITLIDDYSIPDIKSAVDQFVDRHKDEIAINGLRLLQRDPSRGLYFILKKQPLGN